MRKVNYMKLYNQEFKTNNVLLAKLNTARAEIRQLKHARNGDRIALGTSLIFNIIGLVYMALTYGGY